VTRTSWLPFGTHPDAGCRLLCLPHAGAGASVYRTWGSGLAPGIRACPVQPPGRERRRHEPPLTTVWAISKLLSQEIIAHVGVPFAILGHSTGALCAFEVTRELRAVGGPLPVHLFVAGRPAPQIPVQRSNLGAISVGELADMLREMGGTPEELIADEGLVKRLQPLLAADFDVNECYDYRAEPPLSVPITAFAATDDDVASLEEMTAWREQTSAGFSMQVLSGGHFAIFDHAAAVHGQIAAALAGPPD
jgi:surfactin synthase thioesterase subunit